MISAVPCWCQSYQWPSCDISFAIALFIVQVGLWAQGGGTLTLMACVHLSLLHGHILAIRVHPAIQAVPMLVLTQLWLF